MGDNTTSVCCTFCGMILHDGEQCGCSLSTKSIEIMQLRAKNAQLASELAGQTHAKEEALGWWKAERERAEKAEVAVDELMKIRNKDLDDFHDAYMGCEVSKDKAQSRADSLAVELVEANEALRWVDHFVFMGVPGGMVDIPNNEKWRKRLVTAAAILDREKVGK